jgi:hypothetical protein
MAAADATVSASMSGPKDKSMKGTTMMSGGGSTNSSSAVSLIVELLLFGQQAAAKRGVNMTQSSFNNTMGSTSSSYVSPVFALRYMLKQCPITTF